MEQLKQLIQAILSGDQAAMQQFQQLVSDPQQGPQVIKAVQILAEQGDPDARQLIEMMQQQAPMSAKLGAKLRTVRMLNNICPEGYELKSFKVGGKVCKRCMKSMQKGDETEKKPTKKESPADEYKNSKPTEHNAEKHYELIKKYQSRDNMSKAQHDSLITYNRLDKYGDMIDNTPDIKHWQKAHGLVNGKKVESKKDGGSSTKEKNIKVPSDNKKEDPNYPETKKEINSIRGKKQLLKKSKPEIKSEKCGGSMSSKKLQKKRNN